MSAIEPTGLDLELSRAKRNVALLTFTQAVLGTIAPISFAIGGLAGYQLLGADKSLATAPLTGFNIGTAIGAIIIAAVSKALGRKASFMVGAGLAAAGGIVAAIALFRSDFWMFALGILIAGISGGFTQKIRFAAADASPSFYKPSAISWILAGGIISAVLGPQIAIFSQDMFAPILFAGAFMAFTPLALVAIGLLLFLQLPELKTTDASGAKLDVRPLGEIVKTQRFITGMICGISTYALMTFMMTGAPLAMVIGCGFSKEMSTLGIQWHVLAMFAPSFFTGKLITHFGSERIVAAGLVILMACAVVAHAGIELWNFWGALILLGIGWNFGFIGATAIIASSYRPQEADKVQGFHDIILFGTVAMSSFASGKVFNAFGWAAMNLLIWPVTISCLILLLLLIRNAPAKSA